MESGIISEPPPAQASQRSLNTFALFYLWVSSFRIPFTWSNLSLIFIKFIYPLEPTLRTYFQMYLETLAFFLWGQPEYLVIMRIKPVICCCIILGSSKTLQSGHFLFRNIIEFTLISQCIHDIYCILVQSPLLE